MKTLLFGAGGQLGSSLLRRLDNERVWAPSRHEVDLEDPQQLADAIDDFSPDVIVNAAAYHYLPDCEKFPEKAFAVNCIAVRAMARACRRHHSKLITFSTDYVFSGETDRPYSEESSPCPLQMYGLSKLAGELAAQIEAPELAFIVRTSGLYGFGGAESKGGNFVAKRLADARRFTSIEMDCRQKVSPTFVEDLSGATTTLLRSPLSSPGVYHLVNEGTCSWDEFTRAIYEFAGLKVNVTPVDRRGLDAGFRRPIFTALENVRAKGISIRLPHWRDALRRYIDDILA